MSWRAQLTADPLPLLLEPENPAVRYLALRDLLDYPPDHADLLEAGDTIVDWPPVAQLLAEQKLDGYWVQRDYYLPKHYGTFWVLSVLGDLGLTKANEHVARGCDYMFGFQRENGAFARRRRVKGQGLVWDRNPGPCTHARILRFLIQSGYSADPRVQRGLVWLIANQRPDGMWDCGSPGRPGCLRATLDVLRVAALEPGFASHASVARAARVIAVGSEGRPALLMARSMSRHHVGLEWTTLPYPDFDYSLISALNSLARLGYTLEYPRMADGMAYLLSRQQPDGSWVLDHAPYSLPFEMGEVGRPSKWLTLDALRAVKLLHG